MYRQNRKIKRRPEFPWCDAESVDYRLRRARPSPRYGQEFTDKRTALPAILPGAPASTVERRCRADPPANHLHLTPQKRQSAAAAAVMGEQGEMVAVQIDIPADDIALVPDGMDRVLPLRPIPWDSGWRKIIALFEERERARPEHRRQAIEYLRLLDSQQAMAKFSQFREAHR